MQNVVKRRADLQPFPAQQPGLVKLLRHVTQAQKFLREDIVDKALKRDMTALFGALPLGTTGGGATVVKIPAPLACYWLGRSEMEAADKQ